MSNNYIKLDDGTVWPIDRNEVQWKLRYGEGQIDRRDLLLAASILSTWGHILDPNVEIGPVIKRIRELRRKVKADYD